MKAVMFWLLEVALKALVYPIAEAMLSGLPAIVTNWSGQLDFVNSQNSWLVDYQFTPGKKRTFGLFFPQPGPVWILTT